MEAYLQAVKNGDYIRSSGKVCDCAGLVVKVAGLEAFVGEYCEIYSSAQSEPIAAEVIGINANKVLLMPYGHTSGVSVGSDVVATGRKVEMPVGDNMLGRVLDAFGNPLDDQPKPVASAHYPLYKKPINPLNRPPIKEILHTGVKAIDSLITVGRGQRLGIFAGSGVGKSTLLGMIAKGLDCDVNVIALVGERGREVSDFIYKVLGEEGLKKSVVIAATSDENALVRSHAAWGATAIAEYFRDQGKKVILTMDSVTRLAMAQREIGLSVGEPPTTKGYTPSVFSVLPRLLERAGTSKNGGSITAFYTVLVEGDDTNEPVSDHVRSILDGTITLSRALAQKRHFPSIDILQSNSRLINDLVDQKEYLQIRQFVEMLELYERYREMVDMGIYNHGTNPKLDKVLGKLEDIQKFLQQEPKDSFTREESLKNITKICNG
ncbi:flagellum-specific ATP synthase [gamma proteobacterium IMCC1989]|nr:flagellum-specific ATP synthase [gamma proteobacterium IMCC1989]